MFIILKKQVEHHADGASWRVRQRPPGAVDDVHLQARCLSCGDCVEVCPRRALTMDKAGLPHLADPDTCSQCGLCADVCMHDAIGFTPETLEGLRYSIAMDRLGDL